MNSVALKLRDRHGIAAFPPAALLHSLQQAHKSVVYISTNCIPEHPVKVKQNYLSAVWRVGTIIFPVLCNAFQPLLDFVRPYYFAELQDKVRKGEKSFKVLRQNF